MQNLISDKQQQLEDYLLNTKISGDIFETPITVPW